ncbi:MAG TPA: 5-dehydro-2-deoxygluconokinase [Steroidobacteraceae bacterium]|jgi:5-dehydro-2-deoxygluconokinase|nr:5-dehydro-2-deoxygluconokinase [Steroidobacteraceae bacterium]
MAEPISGRSLDLITVGRSSVDLYGEQVGGRLEDMGSFAKYIGGSPTNTAVGAARLGLRAGLLTRVGDDHFGRFIREELARCGVDVSGVITDPERLTALAVLGIRDELRFPLLFYRENCADMALCETDVDPAFIRGAGAVLINGTHLSQPGVRAASRRAAELGRIAGGRVVLDIDYRPVLWGLTAPDAGENRFVASPDVTARLQEIAPLCDLIVGTEEEFHILGGSTDTVSALHAVRVLTAATLVCKLGAHGCVAFTGAIGTKLDSGVQAPGFDVEVFNVLGAGDAFMSGFLRGWLCELQIETCCRYGNACGAIVVSRHGCAPAMPTWTELSTFLDGKWPQRLRESEELEHVHWATTRAPRPAELLVLAMDHRGPLEALAAELDVGEPALEDFKALAIDAVDRVARGDPRYGVLLDGRFGRRGLERAADHPYWIGRPIEQSGSRPLAFDGAADVGSTLRTWPQNHVVKCLVRYHPDDPEMLRQLQEERLLCLYSACRETRHELLLEIIASPYGDIERDTTARVLERMYELGIRPDWWKLEPSDAPAAWAAIQDTIRRRDPLCRGVLVLGLAVDARSLASAFRAAAPFEVVRGFAVGRTIFAEPARRRLAGEIGDAETVAVLAANLQAVVAAWREARPNPPA